MHSLIRNPRAGVGIAYRPQLRVELFDRPEQVDYLEITAEHYLDLRGAVRDDLAALAATFPLVIHALGTSIGSADGIEPRYIDRLAALIDFAKPLWWSDHLAFTRAGRRRIGHFVPLRRDRRSIEVVARNADTIRRTIRLPFALENPALPFVIPGGDMDEGLFLAETARAARCRLLLDVENLHANERNFAESAHTVVAAIPTYLIAEIHVAGGRVTNGMYIDSHDTPVPERTWELARAAVERGAAPSITLERDARLTGLQALEPDLVRARSMLCTAAV